MAITDEDRCVAEVVVRDIATAVEPQCIRKGRFRVGQQGIPYCHQHYRMLRAGRIPPYFNMDKEVQRIEAEISHVGGG